MASTSDAPSTSQENTVLIAEFCSITGSDQEKACKILEISNWNIGKAINMHLDEKYMENIVHESDSSKEQDTDGVRPPIPPRRDILVEEDLTFPYRPQTRKRRSEPELDGFRDSQADEVKHQETSTGKNRTRKKKRTTDLLDDLFQPPFDLMYRESFESARDLGQSSNRWLMVNIQNSQEFSCLVLNRDVWRNPIVKSLIKKHFVFWQVCSDSVFGKRYMQFYKLTKFPYIAVIDPRTGENLVVWHDVDSTTLCELIIDTFLKKFSFSSGTSTHASSPLKCSLLDQSENQLKENISSVNESNLANNEDKDGEFATVSSDSESIGVILNKNDIVNSDHSCETIDVTVLNESNGKCDDENESWKNYLGSENDPKTDLILRLPDGRRELITWPCTTKIKSLFLYINELGYALEKYELLVNFSQKRLSHSDLYKTLKEVDLFPREILIVHEKI